MRAKVFSRMILSASLTRAYLVGFSMMPLEWRYVTMLSSSSDSSSGTCVAQVCMQTITSY